MGIYIKKMEMPESCYYCPFADGVWQKDKRCLINGKEMPRDGRDVQQNHINCPLVPVPEHGDLIDRDPFIDFIKTHWDSYDQWFVGQLEARPTIIPAEGGRVMISKRYNAQMGNYLEKLAQEQNDLGTWQESIINEYKTKQTNADRIRAMTDEELAEFLEALCPSYEWALALNGMTWFGFLKQEVSANDS